jgi:hypothetical protein
MTAGDSKTLRRDIRERDRGGAIVGEDDDGVMRALVFAATSIGTGI